MIVGLTGGIGSGKSTVAKMFSNFSDVAVYIADDEARKLVNTSNFIKEQIIQEFGRLSYINNELNRPYIAKVVFEDKDKLKKLNAIVHPEVRKHFIDFEEKNKNKSYIVYEAAILFEAKADKLCDRIITVYADKKVRLERVLERDKTTKKEVEKRMNNQWKDDKKLLLSNYIIYNIDLTKTRLQVRKIHNILTNYC